MSAGIYAARRKLDLKIISKDFGGYVKETEKIENYLGFNSISGLELAKKFEDHLRSYDLDILEDAEVKKVYEKDSIVMIELENGKSFKSKTAIIAAGSKRRKLDVPGEKEFLNKGVTYCAICDGPIFQDQEVAVIGGGYSGTQSALYLSKIAKKVYLLELEENLRGEKIVIDKLKENKNIEIITKSKVTEIIGKNSVEGLRYLDLKNNKEKQLKVSGISIEIGMIPNSYIADVKKNKEGYIQVDENMKTSNNRIFAVGDINDKGPEQIAVAVGQGCIAALEAEKTILSK